MAARIGVGIAGSGFVARFHVQSSRGVRDADMTAISLMTATSQDPRTPVPDRSHPAASQ